MAIKLDPTTATMSVDKAGSKSAIHVGRELVLLHGTRNAVLSSADTSAGGKQTNGPSIVMTGKVFMDAAATDFDLGDFQFGMIQVSTVVVYEFVYAGRMSNEGSVKINLKAGFTKNPSLDAETTGGGTIDETIFDSANQTFKRVTTPRPGFEVTYKSDDHPSTLVPQKVQNSLTNAPNFISSARRDEGLIAYFVARQSETSPVIFLSRLGWHGIWHGTFKWSVATNRPTVTLVDSQMQLGSALLGSPPATDAEFLVAKARVGPITNDLDKSASDDAFVNRRSPVFVASRDRPI
ncbi:MAG: hypothetical protein K8T89_18025, partial [Planctomycetes bacterium]|nr:hypothetical protein [Planctomycetota bacterium]